MRILFCKALAGLLVFDLLGLGHDFPKMHRLVRSWKISPTSAPSTTVEQVCRAINYACVYYPKSVRCLQRSIVTTCLLRGLGEPAQVVMGVQKVPFKAHAWTEIDGQVINERRDVQKIYRVLERC